MNAAEAAGVLTVASSFDRRTVGEADARAWAAALPDIRFEDARDAVVAHYRTTRDWVMPADILRRVRIIRRDRMAGMPNVALPPSLGDNPRREVAWLRTVKARYADGLDLPAAVAETCERFSVPVPPDISEAVDPARIRALLANTTQEVPND